MIKKILILLICCVAFFSSYAQFPGTDSLRNFNNRWITNSAIQAFTNYRLNTLLNGMIDWIDSARAGVGGTIGVDSIGVLNDSTFRYRKNGVFQSIVIKGGAVQHDITLTGTGLSGSHLKVDTTILKTVADAQRVTDSLVALLALKLNISDTAAMMQPLYDYIASDTIHIYTAADPNPDTLYSYKNGDSTLVGLLQKGGTDNANIGSGFRVLVPSTQEVKTLFSDVTGAWDSTSNADGLTYKVDTLAMSTRAWRHKGDDSVAAVLRQVVIDTANSLLASMSDSVVFAVSNMLIPARIEFVHAGSDTTMYQNDTLIGKQIVDVSIEGYKLGFTARATSVYMEFDSVTGTITLTNGAFVADDLILIIYRTPPIFLLDGSGNPVRDGSGNFIILN